MIIQYQQVIETDRNSFYIAFIDDISLHSPPKFFDLNL